MLSIFVSFQCLGFVVNPVDIFEVVTGSNAALVREFTGCRARTKVRSRVRIPLHCVVLSLVHYWLGQARESFSNHGIWIHDNHKTITESVQETLEDPFSSELSSATILTKSCSLRSISEKCIYLASNRFEFFVSGLKVRTNVRIYRSRKMERKLTKLNWLDLYYSNRSSSPQARLVGAQLIEWEWALWDFGLFWHPNNISSSRQHVFRTQDFFSSDFIFRIFNCKTFYIKPYYVRPFM